jgi:hypothetical protein
MNTLLPLIAETNAKALIVIKALDVETETADLKVLFVLRSRTLFFRDHKFGILSLTAQVHDTSLL